MLKNTSILPYVFMSFAFCLMPIHATGATLIGTSYEERWELTDWNYYEENEYGTYYTRDWYISNITYLEFAPEVNEFGVLVIDSYFDPIKGGEFMFYQTKLVKPNGQTSYFGLLTGWETLTYYVESLHYEPYNSVPEPTTMVLVVIGLLVIIVVSIKQKTGILNI